MIKLGPILGYHGDMARSVVAVLDNDPQGLTPFLVWHHNAIAQPQVTGEMLGHFEVGKSSVWKFSFDLTGLMSGTVDYEVRLGSNALSGAWIGAGYQFRFTHEQSLAAMNILFGSCVDIEKGASEREQLRSKGYGAFIAHLPQRVGAPIHLMLLGGDQVYTDKFLPDKAWQDRPGIQEEIAQGLRACYLNGWTKRAEFARLLAEVPSAMMWDDHDIVDGYGSQQHKKYLKQEMDQGGLTRLLFPEAARLFDMLQLRQPPRRAVQQNVSWVYSQDNTIFAALDARTERDIAQKRIVSSESLAHWHQAIEAKIAAIGEGRANLVLIVPIPLLHLRYDAIMQSLVREIPLYGDDIADNWSSSLTLGEEHKMIELVAQLRSRVARLVILSGDSHMASAGMMRVQHQGQTLVVQQVTSSGLENQSGALKSAVITGVGGEVPGNDLRHLLPWADRNRWFTFANLAQGLKADYRLLPVNSDARGFDANAKHYFFDKNYFYPERNAVILNIGAQPSIRCIFSDPSKQPRSPWLI